MTPAGYALLGSCVFLAGVVDALAGGGGLITLPAYLAAGLDPAFVLGTNKLVSMTGTVAATARYHRAARIPFKRFLPALAVCAAAAWVGARLAVRADPSWLRPMLLAALPVLGWLIWSHPEFGRTDHSERLTQAQRRGRELLVTTPIGAYDGFFGPGAGVFYALGFTRACGCDLVGATARAKAANLVSNAGALAAFVLAGRVRWEIGLPMAALSAAGNWTGAHLGVKRGAEAIRPVVILVCAGLFLKTLADIWRQSAAP
ncbi:MAG: TSUP family transporter [Elusimicrobia bacterium]|nr:TSUP family transporter [Elusimicrobiota bacterium]